MPQFLVTLAHAPESCAFTDPVRRQRAQEATARLPELADAHGIQVHQTFANIIEHRAFLHFDAPDMSAIERLLIETHMFAQNSCRIEPVRPLAEASNLLAELA